MVLSRLRRRATAPEPSPEVLRALGENGWDPSTPARDALLAAPREEQVQHALAVAALAGRRGDDWWRVHELLGDLLRRKLPWTDEQLVQLIDDTVRLMRVPRNIVRTLERRGGPLPPGELADAVKRLHRKLDERYADEQKLRVRLEALLGRPERPRHRERDPWLDAMEAAGDPSQLAFAGTASSTPPPKKWQTAAPEHVSDAAVAAIRAALSVPKPESSIPPGTGDVLRGLVFLAAMTGTPGAARALGDLAIAGYRKIPYHGPLCSKAANAAMHALSEMDDGPAQLARARSALRQPTAAEKVEQALGRAARRRGVSRDELEELVVPDFGLDADSVARIPIGEYRAELRLLPGQSTDLRFVDPSGRSLKTVPKALKESHPGEIAAVKAQAKDLRDMAAAERRRLERLYVEDRAWDYATWRERYLDHGLTGHFARRLIWWFGSDAALGPPAEEPAPDTPVRLWHPAGAETEQVRRWRAHLEEHGIQQPFKQAHREVYLLTPAELETETYSNRFAAHVLEQHKLAALCRDRGWRYSLMGAWDSANEPTLELPRWDLRATFWVEAPWNEESDVNAMGIFMHVLTDQVRFSSLESGAAVPLADVPLLVFTEVMRDVDLFVGVASVGNDPTWHDRQTARAEHLDYWHAYAFGEMGEQAQVRKDVLERLLPKLKIAGVAEVDGRFLRVRGNRRTYKIHLGSGNIQMEPNDQYLCIVPERLPEGGRVWLPFEGDRTLAVILSKAFLLADDANITDRTILQQLR